MIETGTKPNEMTDFSVKKRQEHFSIFLMYLFQYARNDEMLARLRNGNILEGPGLIQRKAEIKRLGGVLDNWLSRSGCKLKELYAKDDIYAYLGHLFLHVSTGNLEDAKKYLLNELSVFLQK